ncbi:hypothetical protein ACFL4E_03155 [Candidatus Omnitrophota bacterium]
MKYRTVIELICDASDREEASNIAGDYLKGEVDFGVEMNCKTASLWSHRVTKYAVSSALVLLVFSTLLLKVTPISVEDSKTASSRFGFQNTYTVMPALKTKHKADFRKEWEQKKDEAVLEFLKN